MSKKRINLSQAGHRRTGITLVEAAASTVIVGVMLVASLEGMRTVIHSRQAQSKELRGRALATDLLAEILQMPYEEPGDDAYMTWEVDSDDVIVFEQPESQGSCVFGPESGEPQANRAYFDDVDDYNGWSESTVTLKDGTTMTNAEGWTRQVSVEYADPTTLMPYGTDIDTGLKLVRVIVIDPNGEITEMTALRSRLGSPDFLPLVETTYMGWVGIDLQLGDDPAGRVQSSVFLMNQPIATDRTEEPG
jgi:type II secretory pathway pseudopilin PulG